MSTEFDLRLQSPEWEEGGPKSWNWFKIKGWKSRTPEYILVFEYANNRLVWFTWDVGEVENSPQGGEEPGIGGADLEKEVSVWLNSDDGEVSNKCDDGDG